MTNEPPPYPGDSPGADDSTTSGLPSYGSVQPPEDSQPPPAAPPPPPPAPGGSAEGFSAPSAISWGWRKFTQNVGPILLAALLFLIVSVAVSVVGGAVVGQSAYSMTGGFSIGALLVQIVSTVVSFVIGAVIARGALDVVDGQPFDLSAAFGKIDVVKVIIASVIVSVLTSIGFALLFIPGVIVYFLTYFTVFYVVDDAPTPWEAVTSSVKLISGRVGDSLLLAILNILVLIVGAIAILVGLLVAYPVTVLASAYAYRMFRGQPVAA